MPEQLKFVLDKKMEELVPSRMLKSELVMLSKSEFESLTEHMMLKNNEHGYDTVIISHSLIFKLDPTIEEITVPVFSEKWNKMVGETRRK